MIRYVVLECMGNRVVVLSPKRYISESEVVIVVPPQEICFTR